AGGPITVYEPGSPKWDPAVFDLGIPVLGLCYGMQLACHVLGGEVKPGKSREFGRKACRIHEAAGLFEGLPPDITVWMSHGDQVEAVSGDFLSLAATDTCPIAAVRHFSRPVYGLQFHPEVSHTPAGITILPHFLYGVWGCPGGGGLSLFIAQTVHRLRDGTGTSRVICGLSGGADSSVTAALLVKAIGPQVACIFVDNGLLRANEVDAVRRMFHDHFR